jgi:hypothetical protein
MRIKEGLNGAGAISSMVYAGIYLLFAALVAAVCWPTWAPGTPAWAMLLWPSLVAAAGVTLGRRPGAALLERLLAASARWDRRGVLGAAGGVFVGLCLVARLVLDAFPNSADEYAYVLQAQTYAMGRLWVEAPPFPDLFQQMRFVAKDGIWISSYQPGWALLLAPAALAGAPLWLVGPLIGAATVVAFFALAREETGRPYAWIATLALVTSAFFVLNLGSFFSHGAAAFAAVLFALCGHRFLKTGRVGWALLAGACLGYLGFIRAFNAPLIGLSFVVALLMTPGRRGGLVWVGLAGAPFLAVLLAYNAVVTGDPLLQVQEWVSRKGEPVGGPSLASVAETVRRLARLALWTSPVLLPAWAAAGAGLAWRRKLSFIDWIFPVTVLGFLFYSGSGGNQYGPRYLFEGWPFALITCAKALEFVMEAAPRGRAAAWAASVLGVHLAFQSGYLPARLALEHLGVREREDVYRQVAQTVRAPAVVIISGQVGRLDPMPDFDLSRNGLKVGAEPVVYAIDPTLKDARLRAMFPDRRFYVYRQGRLEPLP